MKQTRDFRMRDDFQRDVQLYPESRRKTSDSTPDGSFDHQLAALGVSGRCTHTSNDASIALNGHLISIGNCEFTGSQAIIGRPMMHNVTAVIITGSKGLPFPSPFAFQFVI